MELTKTGFKQTEVGMIPEEWDVFIIQSLIENNAIISHLDGNHGALYPRSNEFTNSGVPYITANDFINGYVNFKNVRYLPLNRAEQFQKGIAKNGDVLFAHNATVGPTAILKTNFDYVILSTTATYFRTDGIKLNNEYLRYFFESQFFVRQYSAVMRQSTRNQIPITQQRKFSVTLPPTLNEQNAIATALSDVDSLISSLDKLIIKKKAIKQGAMKELLTPPQKGGERLSGFNGEWEERTLGELCKITTGKLDANAMVPDGDYRFYTCAKNYFFIDKYAFDTEALLVSGNGANVGYIHYFKGKFNAYQRTYVLDGFTEDIQFLKCALDVYLSKRINSEKNEGNTPYIKMDTLTEMSLNIPVKREEQKTIAQILSDIDTEIEGLEKKKSKYHRIKQGMMQELLTGKTRLI